MVAILMVTPISTTVTSFSMQHPPKISESCSESSTRARTGSFRYRDREAIISPRFWLDCTGPSSRHITFKIAFLTFEAIRTKQSEDIGIYLVEMLDFQTTTRTLIDRPRETVCMHVNVVKTVFTSYAFSTMHAAPSVWNNLPTHLNDLPLTLETVKNNLYSACTINPTVTDISLLSATAFQFFILSTINLITADIYTYGACIISVINMRRRLIEDFKSSNN